MVKIYNMVSEFIMINIGIVKVMININGVVEYKYMNNCSVNLLYDISKLVIIDEL